MSQVDALWLQYKEKDDAKAREQIIMKYAYLAKYVVDRMCIRTSNVMAYDDLVSYAVIGLINAVERFDPYRAIKFQTYAITRIRGAVLDALKSMDWLPRGMREAGQEMTRTMARLEAETGRTPSDEEVAAAMDVSIDELGRIVTSTGQSAMLSLEELISTGEDYSSESGLGNGSYGGIDPSSSAEAQERKRLLAKAIDELPEREKMVVSLYYKEGLTLKEIAEVLSVTESRACQIHSKAMIRLNGKLSRFVDLMLASA